jgi:hypothetical protein
MKRRFYFILVVLTLLLLAIPGFAAKAARKSLRAQRWLRPQTRLASSTASSEVGFAVRPSHATLPAA